ncbi:hypothetical protein [Evansella halocellulosilytica]|nr:hypothetical protein [Evansella halocellulosilytica]
MTKRVKSGVERPPDPLLNKKVADDLCFGGDNGTGVLEGREKAVF